MSRCVRALIVSPLLRAARTPSRGYILALLLGTALGTLCALFI